MPFFSVIIATLGLEHRPTLRETLRCIKQQTFSDYEVITDDSKPNEYHARNLSAGRARGEVLAFCDDDTTPPKDWLEKASHYFRDKKIKVLTGPISGDIWGWGSWMRVSNPFWAIGANLFIRKSTFMEVGGFKTDWGLTPPPRGWRSDSAILYDIIERYGYESYVHAEDVEMIHPGRMQSVWDTRVEAEFYRRYKKYALRYIIPYDPRICAFIVQNGLESDPRILRYLTHDQKPRLDWIRVELHALDYRLRGRTKILDVGGEDGFLFAGTGWDYTVMDIDLYEVPDGKFVRHDADKPWPFDDRQFDAVVLGEVLEHVENPIHVLKEAYRVSSHMVLATTPNEYEWSEDKAPLLTREERMRRDGFTDIDEMAYKFASKSPYLRELYPESVKPHLWHVRWFDRDGVSKLVSDAGLDGRAEIGEIRYGGFSWFRIKVRRDE